MNQKFKNALMYQEIDMWRKIGKVVSTDDIDFICKRRGFNEHDKSEIKQCLVLFNLFKFAQEDQGAV